MKGDPSQHLLGGASVTRTTPLGVPGLAWQRDWPVKERIAQLRCAVLLDPSDGCRALEHSFEGNRTRGFPHVQKRGHFQAAWAIWEDCCALTPAGVLFARAHQKRRGLQLPARSQAGEAFGTCFVEN